MKYIKFVIVILLYNCTAKKTSYIESNNSMPNSYDTIELSKPIGRTFSPLEQKKVIENIDFGSSEKLTYKNIQAFIKKHKNIDKGLSNPSSKYKFYDYKIGNYEFSEYGVIPSFNENKLYKLDIKGGFIDWEYYDSDVPYQINALSDIIRLQYGNPVDSIATPERYELKTNYTYMIKRWIIGGKTIEIRLQDSGTSYYVNASIYQPDMVDIVKSSTLNKKKEEAEKAKSTF